MSDSSGRTTSPPPTTTTPEHIKDLIDREAEHAEALEDWGPRCPACEEGKGEDEGEHTRLYGCRFDDLHDWPS